MCIIGPDQLKNGSDVAVGSGGSSLGLVEGLEGLVPNPTACQSPINARVVSAMPENVVMRALMGSDILMLPCFEVAINAPSNVDGIRTRTLPLSDIANIRRGLGAYDFTSKAIDPLRPSTTIKLVRI